MLGGCGGNINPFINGRDFINNRLLTLRHWWRFFNVFPYAAPGIKRSMPNVELITISFSMATPFPTLWRISPCWHYLFHQYGAFKSHEFRNLFCRAFLSLVDCNFVPPLCRKCQYSSIFHSVVAVSITRLIYLVGLDIASPDVNWNFASAQIWTCVEMNIAIVSGENRQIPIRKLRLWIMRSQPKEDTTVHDG